MQTRTSRRLPIQSLLARSRARFDFGLVLCALLASACPRFGSGDRETERRDHRDFAAIDVDGELEVSVEQGERFEVVVAIDDNLIDRVETEVVDGALRIRTRGRFGMLVKGPHVRVKMPVLSSLRVAGASDLEAFAFEGSEDVQIRVSGESDVAWEGDALELTATVSGSGDLSLEGHSEWLDLRVSGSGDASARSLVAESARVEVSGSGDATVHVRGELEAEVSGAGDLEVYGDPHFTHRERSGDGDIHVH